MLGAAGRVGREGAGGHRVGGVVGGGGQGRRGHGERSVVQKSRPAGHILFPPRLPGRSWETLGLAGQTGRSHAREDLLQSLGAGHVGARLEHLQLVSDLLHSELDVAESRFREGVALALHSRGELVVQTDRTTAGLVLLYNVI